MLKKLFLCLLSLSLFTIISAQTPLDEAVDFTGTDVEGETHHLFEYLDAGKHVLIEFFFTT